MMNRLNKTCNIIQILFNIKLLQFLPERHESTTSILLLVYNSIVIF